MEEFSGVKKDNEYLKGLFDNGVQDEFQRVGERIMFLND